MTDDECLAQIERWNSGKGGYLPEPIHLIIERLLRIIRDQRAELTQARQAITNMREPFRGITSMENKTMTPTQIELSASLIQRYRHLREVMVELPKKEDVELLALKLTYIGREPNKFSQMTNREIVLADCGRDVRAMIAKLGALADETATRLAERGVDVRDIDGK